MKKSHDRVRNEDGKVFTEDQVRSQWSQDVASMDPE